MHGRQLFCGVVLSCCLGRTVAMPVAAGQNNSVAQTRWSPCSRHLAARLRTARIATAPTASEIRQKPDPDPGSRGAPFGIRVPSDPRSGMPERGVTRWPEHRARPHYPQTTHQRAPYWYRWAKRGGIRLRSGGVFSGSGTRSPGRGRRGPPQRRRRTRFDNRPTPAEARVSTVRHGHPAIRAWPGCRTDRCGIRPPRSTLHQHVR